MKFFTHFLLSIIIAYPVIGQELDTAQENRRREELNRLIVLLKTPGITVREWASSVRSMSTEIPQTTITVSTFERKLINSSQLFGFALRRGSATFSVTLIAEREHIIAAGITQEYPHRERFSRDTLVYATVIVNCVPSPVAVLAASLWDKY